MQQLALQTTSTAYPTRMTALQRDARDPTHAHGTDSFSLSSSTSASKSAHISSAKSSGHPFAGATPIGSNQATKGSISTADVMGPIANIAGGAIMGGPIGALTAAAGELFELISGDSVLGHVADLFETAAPAATTLAQANRAYLGASGLTNTPN